MHYLLGGQQLYFPSSDDQSYTLHEFLKNKCKNEYNLPIIVKITSLNIHGRSIKNLLSKNTPLLLLDTYQFESILAEYHRSNDGRYQSNRRRLTQGKLSSKTATKFRTMKKLSKSLVTLTTTTNQMEDYSDEDYDNTRTIIRTLNEKRSLSSPLCRVPINYNGFFELLNENDQAIEPFHQLSDLLITEYKDENNQQIQTEKWPQAFFLRSTCIAYTKRYIPEERKLSGSADSCYGSLSDLDSHKNLLILNDDKQILQPGQIITILNQCSAYSTETPSIKDLKSEEFISHSSTTSWLRNKSRLFFLKKKTPTSNSHSNNNHHHHQFIKKNIYDISKKSQPYLKCQTEQGDIVYISIYETGLFSPLNSHLKLSKDSENLDISGVFQLKELVKNFRFPISVRLLKNSISFDNIYSPACINQSESSFYSSTKFRLLLPYTEHVIFACPLILSSSFKSQIIVIPIPINSEIEIQRCLNMREILKNKYFHSLIQTCYHIMNQYKNESSYIHFPLVLNIVTKRKQPLFKKKRSQSESHIEYYSLDLIKDSYTKSCETFNDNDDNENQLDMISPKHEQLYHRDSFETTKHKLSNYFLDNNQRQQTIRRSGYYAKLKTDKPRKYSRQPEYDSEDENYRELDHIYDYIRSGDITDDVQRIQAKEQALNFKQNQMKNTSKICTSAVLNVPNSTIKRSERRITPINDNSSTRKIPQFPHNLDDSRPYDDEFDDNNDIQDTQYFESRRNTNNTLFESKNPKPITKMKRRSK
jgi:hypothetical protein